MKTQVQTDCLYSTTIALADCPLIFHKTLVSFDKGIIILQDWRVTTMWKKPSDHKPDAHKAEEGRLLEKTVNSRNLDLQ